MIATETESALQNVRDLLRSARRPGELLSPLDRAALLGTIARVGLAVARDLGSDKRDLDVGDAGLPAAPCPVERLAFLQAVLPQVIAAAGRIASEPTFALRVSERTVPMGRARHVSPSALRTLAQTLPHVSTVRETVCKPTSDTPANRAAKTLLVGFARDLSTVSALAQTAALPAAFAESERLRVHLGRVLRQPFWRDLTVLPRVPSLPATLRKNGAHLLLHTIYRRYRSGFAWDFSHPLFRLSARETWQLYEYWCFFRLIETLQQLGFRVADDQNIVRVSPSGVSLSLATDAASRLTLRRGAQTVTATYQKRFDRGDAAMRGYHSRAAALVPDIVLECAGRLLVLDAKFKTYAEPDAHGGSYVSPLDDMRQLHSYRDAIRFHETRPVSAAWVLYAGRVRGSNRAVIAFPETSPAKPFGNGEVGAVLLRPGTGGEPLAALITAFLPSAHTFALSTHDLCH